MEQEERARRAGKESPRLRREVRTAEKQLAKAKKKQEETAAHYDALRAGWAKHPPADVGGEPVKPEPTKDPEPSGPAGSGDAGPTP